MVPGDKVIFASGSYLGEIGTVKEVNGERVTVTDAYGDDTAVNEWNLDKIESD